MSTDVTPELVAHIARLARLSLSEAEEAGAEEHFRKVLRFVEELDALDLDGVPPALFATRSENAFRADEVRPSLPRELGLANAPATSGTAFSVPRIIAEGGGA